MFDRPPQGHPPSVDPASRMPPGWWMVPGALLGIAFWAGLAWVLL